MLKSKCSDKRGKFFLETFVYTWRKDLLSRKGEVMDMWVFGLVHTCSCEYDQINEEGIFDHLRVLQTHAQIISLCSVCVCVCVCGGGGVFYFLGPLPHNCGICGCVFIVQTLYPWPEKNYDMFRGDTDAWIICVTRSLGGCLGPIVLRGKR